jgi:hypothetical protein
VAHEADPGTTLALSSSPQNYLASGMNVLAVQFFNNTVSNSDIRFDCELQLTRVVPALPPGITAVLPTINSTVTALTQVAVTFDRPVIGVEAGDLCHPGIDQKAVWLSQQGAIQDGHLFPPGWIRPLSRSMKDTRKIPEEAVC